MYSIEFEKSALKVVAHDRIIYNIYDETITILVIQVEEHYKDK